MAVTTKRRPQRVQNDERDGGADEPGQQVPGGARKRLLAPCVLRYAKKVHLRDTTQAASRIARFTRFSISGIL